VSVSTRVGHERLPQDLVSVALALALWVVIGSFVLALAGDLGPHPARRVIVGVFLVALSACAVWQRRAVCLAFRDRPWLVLPLAATQLAAAAFDGLLVGPYVAVSMTSIGLAVIVARTRTVWLCVALLDVGYAAIVFSTHSPAQLARDAQLDGVVGALLGPPFMALALLGLTRLFTRFLQSIDATLDDLRLGGPALTPALTAAVGGGRVPLALPPPRSPLGRLTPAERRVVNELASGRAPKEIAYGRGLSLQTVRTHIKRAKHKTGARTLNELVAMTAEDERDG
jgi:DNA-binding CsgD family transcriptional regulator